MIHRFCIGLLSALALAGSALAADFKVMAPNAAKELVLEAIAVFEKATGHVGADLNLTHGGAAKNLDWLNSDPQAPAVFDGTAEAE